MSSKELAWAMDQRTGSPIGKLVLLLLGDGQCGGEEYPCNLGWLARVAEAGEGEIDAALRDLATGGLVRLRFKAGVVTTVELLTGD